VDLVDVVVVTALLWAGITWLRRTRARLAVAGLAIVVGVYLLARLLGLQLTALILQGFFAVFVIVIVVIFQEDLRRLFEQVAVWGLRRRTVAPPPDVLQMIARAVARLAATRSGALIVIPGRDPLDRHVQGGVVLDARISEPVILSIFDHHSPGHDGAVIVRGDRIARFAVHLPLSSDTAQLGQRGTRHAAALGLAERTDALTIVVSEERGTVSVASASRLRELPDPDALLGEIGVYSRSLSPPIEARSRWRQVAGRWREALLAVAATAALWLLLVPGSRTVEMERVAPVLVENLPSGYVLESVEPTEVKVTLSGRWRDLLFFDRRDAVRVRIDAIMVQLGRRTFQVTPAEVDHPPETIVESISPDRIKVSTKKSNGSAAAGSGGGR
jgi:uncharacterized protein (TIGR00159 family)